MFTRNLRYCFFPNCFAYQIFNSFKHSIVNSIVLSHRSVWSDSEAYSSLLLWSRFLVFLRLDFEKLEKNENQRKSRRKEMIAHCACVYYIPYMIVIDDFVYVRSSNLDRFSYQHDVYSFLSFVFFSFLLSISPPFAFFFLLFSLLLFLVLNVVFFVFLLCLLLSSHNISQHRTPVTYSHDICSFYVRTWMETLQTFRLLLYRIVSYLDRIPVWVRCVCVYSQARKKKRITFWQNVFYNWLMPLSIRPDTLCVW